MRKIILFPIFAFILFVVPAKAQMHLQINSPSIADNLAYHQTSQYSNLNLKVNTSAIANRLDKVRMVLMLNLIYAVTLGNFSDVYKSAFGAEFTFAYIFTRQIWFLGTLGYLSWALKNDLPSGFEQSLTSIPLLFGIRYFILPQFAVLMPYLTLQLGLHFLKEKQTYDFGYVKDEFSESFTKFAMKIGAGFMYYVAAAFLIDFSIRYMYINFAPESIAALLFQLGGAIPLN